MTGRRAGPRQSEAAAGLGAPWIGFSPRFCRAGFEPRRGRPTSLRFEATKTDHTLGDATGRLRCFQSCAFYLIVFAVQHLPVFILKIHLAVAGCKLVP